MPLEKGLRLGPYEIESPIGAGGMGEVYLAHDTRLEREVAIKVLPSHLVGQSRLIERFEREAKMISSLQHPNICSLYDVGHEGGIHFLVMEYLEGITLAERLVSGNIEPATALTYGQQIAEALDAAHRSGIVHRDLKPGNIMITKSGIKLLDFGLAKVHEGASHPASGSLPGLTNMATKSVPKTPLTQEGSILGTFQYMSPEQLEGKGADSRTDIFALGAILYEMLTGSRAFQGDSQASLIASIMSSTPRSISDFETMSPPALESVVATCMAKNPDDRWQTAHDVALQLKWIAEGGSKAGVPTAVSSRRKTRERVAWAVAALATVGLVALGVNLFLNRTPEIKNTLRFQIPVPQGIRSSTSPRISPDGKAVVYLAADTTGTEHIWVHLLNSLEPYPLPGTASSNRPFWSPDSRYLAYFTGSGKLKKIAVAGGPPITIGESKGGADGSWGANDVILFDKSVSDSVLQIPAGGGIPSPATRIDRSRGETGTAWPYFLPDGKHFLFLALSSRPEGTVLKGGTLGSLETKVISHVGTRFEYVEPGYLLYIRSGTLISQPFDAKSLEFTGDPVPVAENVASGGANFMGSFSASLNGVLTFWNNPSGDAKRLRWLSREGEVLEEIGKPAAYGDFRLSPDERKLLTSIVDPTHNTSDLWVMDLVRGTSSRFTFKKTNDRPGVWSPDGSQIVFGAGLQGSSDLYRKEANGMGQPERIHGDESVIEFPHDWSRDGEWLIIGSYGSGTRLNLRALRIGGNGDLIDIAVAEFNENHGRLSPDCRWIAYSTNESGKFEVYVQAFPTPRGKWQISTSGGDSPHWSADGEELYYLSSNQGLMAVSVDGTGESLEVGSPRKLFDAPVSANPFAWSRYEPSKDGQRFLVLSPAIISRPPPITVVVNWLEELQSY